MGRSFVDISDPRQVISHPPIYFFPGVGGFNRSALDHWVEIGFKVCNVILEHLQSNQLEPYSRKNRVERLSNPTQHQKNIKCMWSPSQNANDLKK